MIYKWLRHRGLIGPSKSEQNADLQSLCNRRMKVIDRLRNDDAELRDDLRNANDEIERLRRENGTQRVHLASARATTPEVEQALREEIADLKFRLRRGQDDLAAQFKELCNLRELMRSAIESSAVAEAQSDKAEAQALLDSVDNQIGEALESAVWFPNKPAGFPDRIDAACRIIQSSLERHINPSTK